MLENINSRFKALRESCKKSQEDFGKVLGISKSGISDIENGRRNVTDQHIIMLRNWSEFRINEEWLRTGSGQMFIELPPEDEYVRAAAMIAKDPEEDLIREAIIAYWGLNKEGRKVFKDYLYKLAMRIKKEE